MYYHELSWWMVKMVKNPPAMQETQVRSLGQEDTLEEEMETLSRIPSVLGNPTDRGACQATVHSITQNRHDESHLTTHSFFYI